MTTGTPWLIFGIGAIFCVIMSVLTTYDTLATSEIVHLSPEDYDFDRDAYSKAGTIIWVDDEIYPLIICHSSVPIMKVFELRNLHCSTTLNI